MSVRLITHKVLNNVQMPGEPATLADNGCLPQLVADTFGWEAIQIEFIEDSGNKYLFGACRNGKKIVLLPHFSYGPSAKKEVAREIILQLKNQGYHCEWRLFEEATNFSYRDKVTSFLDLETTVDAQFNKLKGSVRHKIRKCASNGILFKKGKAELLADFYDIYSHRMHQFGSPALPYRWFKTLILEYVGGDASIWCAYLNGKPVGASFMLGYNGFHEACWVATDPAYNRYYTTYGLYWSMIATAIGQDGKQFSFGRSTKGSSVHIFKQQWGGHDLTLFWNYSHSKKSNIRRFTFLTKIWKLLPLPLVRIIGPSIAGRLY